MDTMDKKVKNDEELLAGFFAAHQMTVPDNGFTERVMSALPERPESLQLRRWSSRLNLLGAVGMIVLLSYIGFFTKVWDFLGSISTQCVNFLANFDFDSFLVTLMLFAYHLPEHLPSATQLIALSLTTVILLMLIYDRLAKQA